MRSPRHLFSLQGQVSRAEYIEVGVILMIFKYVVESIVLTYYSGVFYSPLDFFNPLLSARSQFTLNAPNWLGFAWVVWTIPFVWIAVAMSMRRAIDAGASPWAGMFMLVPVLNLMAMIYLAYIPAGYASHEYVSRVGKKKVWNRNQRRRGIHISGLDLTDEEHVNNILGIHAAFVGMAVGFAYMFSLVFVGIYVFKSYGAAMFFGTPLVAGAATAYTYNRWCPRSIGSTVGLSLITGAFFAAGLLLLGLEGMVCIAMAAPIMLPIGILGAARVVLPLGNLDAEGSTNRRRGRWGNALLRFHHGLVCRTGDCVGSTSRAGFRCDRAA